MSNEDGFLCEMFSFENYCIKESYFVISYSGRGLNFWDGIISFFNKRLGLFCPTVPKKGNVINETFLLVFLCWIRFVSVSALWIFAKDTAVFMPNATPWV